MVSGAADLTVTAALILGAVLLSHRAFSQLLLYREWPNPYVRIAAVTVGSVVSGLAIALAVLGKMA